MDRVIGILAVVISTTLLPGCKNDNNPLTPTTGTIHGAVAYTGTAGTVGVTKLVAVAIYPFSNSHMQGPPNGSTIQVDSSADSPFAYLFQVPPGDYHLCVVFDANGDGNFNSGLTDPYLIYTPGNVSGTGTFGTAAARFTVNAGGTHTANVQFGDTYKK